MKAVVYTPDDNEYSVIDRIIKMSIKDPEIYRSPLDGHGHYSARFDIAVIAVDGAAGMEIMLELSERYPDTKIIWITDDKHFAGMAIRKHISGFILRDYEEEKLLEAVKEAAKKCAVTTTWHFGKKKPVKD